MSLFLTSFNQYRKMKNSLESSVPYILGFYRITYSTISNIMELFFDKFNNFF